MTIYAAHQPDLLPYSGFWHKLAKSDIFDLKVWDQYVDRGYQRRVTMRDKWVSLPVENPRPVTDPIFTKRFKPEAASYLVDQIVKRYTSNGQKPVFWDRSTEILDEVLSITTDKVWEFNFELLLLVRRILGIQTAVSFSRDHDGIKGGAGIVHVMNGYNIPGMTYLSGPGARAYMGDCADFTAAGYPVLWSKHKPVTGDSILSVIFDYENPLAVVMAEETDPEKTEQEEGG